MNKISLISFFIASFIILLVGIFGYPKWQEEKTEATISWDVSGYYFYLPSLFIYKDIKEVKFKDDIIQKYTPSPQFDQGYLHESGNYVMKYSSGLAVQYLPAFFIAHLVAHFSSYEADGFSFPYQVMISFWSMFIALLGLYFLRKSLLIYFKDSAVGITILLVVIGTNYLNYSAIDGAMTHNYLFTIYGILIWLSHSFYAVPNLKKALSIGILVGLAALTRPTEIISLLIPLLWGIESINDLKTRFQFIRKNISFYFLAAIATIFVGSIQLVYWKYVTGEWIVYSYQEQGFSWLNPHFIDGFFSFRKGWLIYTPIMLFSLGGFIFLYLKNKKLFLPLSIFSGIFIYITFAWDIWWYGGSLGQRAMVQSYAVLAFPLCAYVTWMLDTKMIIRGLSIFFMLLFSYYNLWLTHQAHGGGLLNPDHMTKAYFFKILGKYKVDRDAFKLLDTDEEFLGERRDVKVIYENDFEADSTAYSCAISPIEGNKAFCLNKQNQYSPLYKVDFQPININWVRFIASVRCTQKEWNTWRMAQLTARFYNYENVIKERNLRIFRILNDQETRSIFLDMRIPENETITHCSISFGNSGSDKTLVVDDIRIESFSSLK
jgi:hypothetical protein